MFHTLSKIYASNKLASSRLKTDMPITAIEALVKDQSYRSPGTDLPLFGLSLKMRSFGVQ